MATWKEFEQEAPDMAAVAGELWPGITALHEGAPLPAGQHVFSIAYLATVRRDGAPRLHPICPILAGGRLFAAIPRRSPKGHDLRREPRAVIHALPGPEDDESCLRVEAHAVADDATRAMVLATVERSGVGGMVETTTHDPLFEFDLQLVEVARWLEIGQPGTRAERQQWRAG